VQSDAGRGMHRPVSMPRDGRGGQHRTSAGADKDGKGEAGEEDEGENEDNVDDYSGGSALDQTWSASTNDLEASGDEDSEEGLPAVHAFSGYAALNAEKEEEGRGANFNRHKGPPGAAVRRAAAGACMQTRSALRSVGKVGRKWMAKGEFVGWGGLWGVGFCGFGSSSLELQKSVLGGRRNASSLILRSVHLVGSHAGLGVRP
jgi:hypothetical protein